MNTVIKTICPTLSKEFGKSRTNGLVTLIFSSHLREEEQSLITLPHSLFIFIFFEF